MLDVVGTTLTDDDIRRLAHPMTGGIILFARNFTTARSWSRSPTRSARCATTSLIAVDHEGGRVQRFRTDGFTVLPRDAQARRAVGHATCCARRKAATAVGYVLAAELRACGIDMSFTPVLDLELRRSRR